MTRWKASGLHLLISTAVAAAVVSLLFFVWYPGPLYEAAGGERLTFLLIAIDVVVGPVLTLLVYRAGKPGLRFDLLCIGLAQGSFLAYGLSVITAARPVFVVLAVDRFVAVSANQLEDADLAFAPRDEWKRRGWSGPRWVAARMPSDPEQANEIMFSALRGKDLERYPRHYDSYASQAAAAAARAQPLEKLRGKDARAAALVDAMLAGRDAAGAGWLPLVARGRDMVVLIERSDGKVLGILPIDPW
jgi:hypothetical protein